MASIPRNVVVTVEVDVKLDSKSLHNFADALYLWGVSPMSAGSGKDLAAKGSELFRQCAQFVDEHADFVSFLVEPHVRSELDPEIRQAVERHNRELSTDDDARRNAQAAEEDMDFDHVYEDDDDQEEMDFDDAETGGKREKIH